jgi:hypothetical protein
MLSKSVTQKQKQLIILLQKKNLNTNQNTSNTSITCYWVKNIESNKHQNKKS